MKRINVAINILCSHSGELYTCVVYLTTYIVRLVLLFTVLPKRTTVSHTPVFFLSGRNATKEANKPSEELTSPFRFSWSLVHMTTRLPMLLQLPDECKQQVWGFFGFRELCRVCCVARGVARGVDARLLWQRRALELLQDEQAQMHARTGLLGHRLQRGFASRNLLSTGDAPSFSIASVIGDERAGDALDWRHWYRDTYQVSAVSRLSLGLRGSYL